MKSISCLIFIIILSTSGLFAMQLNEGDIPLKVLNQYVPDDSAQLPEPLEQTIAHHLKALIQDNNIKEIQRFLSNLDNLEFRLGGKTNKTMLLYAAKHNHVEICKLLIEYGANLNAIDEKGNTVFALCENNEALKQLFIEENATLTDDSNDLISMGPNTQTKLANLIEQTKDKLKNIVCTLPRLMG